MMNYAEVSKYFFFLIILMFNFQIVVTLQTAEAGRRKEILTIIPIAAQSVFYILISKKVFFVIQMVQAEHIIRSL